MLFSFHGIGTTEFQALVSGHQNDDYVFAIHLP
jgi:hypothetical protein